MISENLIILYCILDSEIYKQLINSKKEKDQFCRRHFMSTDRKTVSLMHLKEKPQKLSFLRDFNALE